MAKPKSDPNYKVIAENRRARYDYAIEEDIECGMLLHGSEVKSLRENSSNIAESYAEVKDGELWLVNSYIAPYERAMFSHTERRRRKLLVSKKELAKLWADTQRKGMTLVPLVLYFNHRGLVKLKIGVARSTTSSDGTRVSGTSGCLPQKSPIRGINQYSAKLGVTVTLKGRLAAPCVSSITVSAMVEKPWLRPWASRSPSLVKAIPLPWRVASESPNSSSSFFKC